MSAHRSSATGEMAEAVEIDASRANHNLKAIIAEHGETVQQARQRVGINDAKNVMVVVFG
jgi:hypothetical protein